ncbi:MAG: hypothetical protein HFH26_11235 [Clostridiaceae bacterium]|nr:hypothetical protein [Clostridiaceae bacterium]
MIYLTVRSDGLSYAALAFFIGPALGIAFLALLLGSLWLGWRFWMRHRLPPEARAKQKAWRKHPFYKVSKRARAAYLILCLEEVLRASGQDFSRWSFVRRELWEVTRMDEEDWAFRVSDLMPDVILSADSYKDLVTQRRETSYPLYAYGEEDFNTLYALYQEAGDALDQIDYVMSQILDVIIYECGQGETPYTPESLRFIGQTQEYLRSHGIPLPQNAEMAALLMQHCHPHSGKPFPPPPVDSSAI